MGAQLLKGYSVEAEPFSSDSRSWKIFRVKRDGSNAPGTAFIIDKKSLKRADKDELLRKAKKEVSCLARVRHPGVLAIMEPLIEDEAVVAFVTEKVEGSLAHVIGKKTLQNYISCELELKLALYPLLEAVVFLQENVKQAHLGISLETIYLTPDGKMKLSGFGQNQLLTGQLNQQMEEKGCDCSFASPEVALRKVFCRSSDTFSVGLVIVKLIESIYNMFTPLCLKNQSEYEGKVGELKGMANEAVVKKSRKEKELREMLVGALEWECQNRWSVSDVLGSKWMNDSMVLTVKHLDKISNFETKQQIQFLKGLAGVIGDFDRKLATKVLFPKLMELLKFSHLNATLMYIVIDSLKKDIISREEFKKSVWPHLRTVLQAKELSAQSIYLAVKEMEFLQKCVGEVEVEQCIMPLFLKCFDCPPKLKQLALSHFERVCRKTDTMLVKVKLMPKLLLILKDENIQIRKDSLRALLATIHLLDVQTITFSVVPALEACRKVGGDPFINAISNHIYNQFIQGLPADIIATKILPIFIPYLIDASIRKNEFASYKSTIMGMIGKIESERNRVFDSTSDISVSFVEADFRFKQESVVEPTLPANYNFLNNYIQPFNTNQNVANNVTSNFPQNSASNATYNMTQNVPQPHYSFPQSQPRDSFINQMPIQPTTFKLDTAFPAFHAPTPTFHATSSPSRPDMGFSSGDSPMSQQPATRVQPSNEPRSDWDMPIEYSFPQVSSHSPASSTLFDFTEGEKKEAKGLHPFPFSPDFLTPAAKFVGPPKLNPNMDFSVLDGLNAPVKDPFASLSDKSKFKVIKAPNKSGDFSKGDFSNGNFSKNDPFAELSSSIQKPSGIGNLGMSKKEDDDPFAELEKQRKIRVEKEGDLI